MEDLVKAVEAADSIYAVLAIAIIGLYALIWRFGDKMITAASENAAAAKAAHSEAEKISASIVTNHGSENIGHAVDRLYELVVDIDQRVSELEKRDAA